MSTDLNAWKELAEKFQRDAIASGKPIVLQMPRQAGKNYARGGMITGNHNMAGNHIHATLSNPAESIIPRRSALWRDYGRAPSCGARKGGPRSQIFCEIPEHAPHPLHTGRGKWDKYYNWKNEEFNALEYQ